MKTVEGIATLASPIPHSRGTTARHWPALDGLRGCAVIAVVLFHLGVLPRGYLGVDVFFVLSGFLITTLVLSEFNRTGTVSLRRFYFRRSLRLYPALLAVVAFCVAVSVATRSAVPSVMRDSLLSVLYLANLSSMPSGLLDHTWTLALEEQFYLLWPALLLWALRRGKVWWSFAPAMTVVVGLLIADLASGSHGPFHTYTRAMGLPLGCALALMATKPRATHALAKVGWVAGLVLLVLLAVPLPPEFTTGWPVSLAALVTVPVGALLTSRSVPLLENAWLRWFGLRSYSLYLWHFPLLMLCIHHAPPAVPSVVRHLIGIVASLLAAELSYRLIEQPILRIRDRRSAPRGVVTLRWTR